MKKITLQFYSKALEDKYQKYIEQVYIPKLSVFLNYVLIVLVIPCIIMGLYYNQNLGASLYMITALSIIMYKILIRKFRQFYNIYLFIMELSAQVLMGCRLYIDGPTLNNQDIFCLFFFGASLIQIQFIMHSISQNFLFPVITTITQLIIFISLAWNVSMYDCKFSYIIFTICTTYFLHHNLKEKKEIFMFREQQKQWIKILKNGISQKIITIQYNQKQNELTLNIINKNASEKFKIQNEQDFKLFSRRVKLFKKEIDAYEDYDKKQIYRESKVYAGNSVKNTTLESRIVQFMKHNINTKKKRDSVKLFQSQSIISKTNSEIPLKNKNLDSSSKQISIESIKQAEYYAIIQSEQKKPEIYKIKMSYFLNEGQHQCYIIFDQQSEEDIIKNIISSKKKIELGFINVCQQLGLYNQVMQQNLHTMNFLKQYLFLSQNKLKNICDYYYYVNKGYEISQKIRQSQIKYFSLIQLNNVIKETFWQLQEKISFFYVSCDSEFIVVSNLQKLLQILINFIQNSYNQELIETKIQKFDYLEQQEDSIDQNNKNFKQQELSQTFTQNTDSSPKKLLKKNKSNENFYNTESTSLNNQGFFMNKNNSKANQFDNTFNQPLDSPIICKQNSINHKNKLRIQNLNIKFKLFEGENTKSNVLKISVSDKSGGINPKNLLQILKEMSLQKYNKDLENFVYQNLGWKMNMHNIGLIGPYADFFISPKTITGLKICFYVYGDINVVSQSENRVVFQNQNFFEDYQRLKSTYYHKDSKQIIKNLPIKDKDCLGEDLLKLLK
ncbi:hypothetical protein ABPG72_005688 [Tetrahymena utriculariae]